MSLVDHGDAMTEASNQLKIMLDQDDGAAASPDVPHQRGEALALQLGETGRGLIEQQEPRLRYHRARDLDEVPPTERQGLHDGIADVVKTDSIERAVDGLRHAVCRERPEH